MCKGRADGKLPSRKDCKQGLNSADPRMKHGGINPVINEWQKSTL